MVLTAEEDAARKVAAAFAGSGKLVPSLSAGWRGKTVRTLIYPDGFKLDIDVCVANLSKEAVFFSFLSQNEATNT